MTDNPKLPGSQYVLLTKYITIIPAIVAPILLVVGRSIRGINFPVQSQTLINIAFVLWFLLIMMMFYQTTVTCPHCKKRFNIRGTNLVKSYNPFRLRCGSCGLRADGKNIAEMQSAD